MHSGSQFLKVKASTERSPHITPIQKRHEKKAQTMSCFPNCKKITLGTDLPVVIKASGALRDLVNPVVLAAQSARGVY